jgi:hypothetical protein
MNRGALLFLCYEFSLFKHQQEPSMKKCLILLIALMTFNVQAAWKSVLISGDHSIPNFDNGRTVIADILDSLGAYEQDQTHLTSTNSLARGDVRLATLQNIATTFRDLKVDQENDKCFVFMTSHGIKDYGFYLSQGGAITPAQMSTLVNHACGNAPTVVLVSACYSGQFVEALAGDNRIVMTAAIKDRPSFGCSTDTTYTFWDGCLVDSLPLAATWEELYTDVKSCVTEQEQALGFRPSLPQASFGKNMRNLPVLN